MTHQELESLLKLLRKEGVEFFKGLGIEVTLSSRPPLPTISHQSPVTPSPSQGEMEANDESLLFWSVTE